MDPLPTPYDITPLPRFGYEPTMQLWISLAILAAIGLLWIIIKLRRRKPLALRGLEAEVLLEEYRRTAERLIQSIRTEKVARNNFELFIRTVKRMLDLGFSLETTAVAGLTELSPSDIRERLRSPLPSDLKGVLEKIATVSEFLYAPEPQALVTSEVLFALLNETEAATQAALLRARAKKKVAENNVVGVKS
jgi:hypothetical protein